MSHTLVSLWVWCTQLSSR